MPPLVLPLLLSGVLAPPPPLAPELVPPETDISISLMLKLADDKIKSDAKAGRLNKAEMTPAALAERYGISQETFNKIERWLQAGGLELAPTDRSGRLMIPAHGTAAQMNKLFGIHLHRVKGYPLDIHAPDVKPKLPEWVQQAVRSINGLDTRPVKVNLPKKYQSK